jgi:hypothetical protein
MENGRYRKTGEEKSGSKLQAYRIHACVPLGREKPVGREGGVGWLTMLGSCSLRRPGE